MCLSASLLSLRTFKSFLTPPPPTWLWGAAPPPPIHIVKKKLDCKKHKKRYIGGRHIKRFFSVVEPLRGQGGVKEDLFHRKEKWTRKRPGGGGLIGSTIITYYLFLCVFFLLFVSNTMNYPKKPGFKLYQSRHCAYIIYSVKTWFLKNLYV